MLPKGEIERYGGKAVILNHIRDKLPDIPIPRYVVKEYDQNLDSVLADFNKMQKPVIVRSSSPYEYGDFEGIFESVRDVKDIGSFERAVRKVEASAISDRAKQYAEQHGFKIDERIHVIVQEQSPSIYCGAIMRHPNNPNLIFINYFEGRGKFVQNYKTFLFNESDDSENLSLRGFHNYGISKKEAKFLVKQYKKIEGLEEIANEYSLFVEFGLEPFAIYQARPFKKKQTADFEVPKANDKDNCWTDFVFGITPPEGIVLPVVRSLGEIQAKAVTLDLRADFSPDGSNMIKFSESEMDLFGNLVNLGAVIGLGGAAGINPEDMVKKILKNWHIYAEEMKFEGKPYCLAISSAQGDGYDTDLTVPNIKALLIGETDYFLTHNLIRLFKRADIVLGNSTLLVSDFYKNLSSFDDEIRIISNGKEAIAIKE